MSVEEIPCPPRIILRAREVPSRIGLPSTRVGQRAKQGRQMIDARRRGVGIKANGEVCGVERIGAGPRLSTRIEKDPGVREDLHAKGSGVRGGKLVGVVVADRLGQDRTHRGLLPRRFRGAPLQ